jgi:hypothetical protein
LILRERLTGAISAFGGLQAIGQSLVGKALEIVEAAQERLKGRPGKLVGIVRDLKAEVCSTSVALSPSLSVLPSEPLTFKVLSGLYMDELKDNVQATAGVPQCGSQ